MDLAQVVDLVQPGDGGGGLGGIEVAAQLPQIAVEVRHVGRRATLSPAVARPRGLLQQCLVRSKPMGNIGGVADCAPGVLVFIYLLSKPGSPVGGKADIPPCRYRASEMFSFQLRGTGLPSAFGRLITGR